MKGEDNEKLSLSSCREYKTRSWVKMDPWIYCIRNTQIRVKYVYSSRRDSILEQLKSEMTPDTSGFHVLYPTLLTDKAANLKTTLPFSQCG